MNTYIKLISEKFVGHIVRRPWLTMLLSGICVAVVCLGFGGMRTNFTHTAYFEPEDPALQRFDSFERRFGNDDAVVVVVSSPSGIFDSESAGIVRELTKKMWLVPDVIRVESLSNFQWVHAKGDDIEIEPLLPLEGEFKAELLAERKKVALEHELLPGYLVNRDGTSALVYARIKPGLDSQPNWQAVVEATREVVTGLESSDHEFHLLGGPVINDAFRESSARDMSLLVPALLLMVAGLLIAKFRRVGAVVMSFAVIILTVSATLACSGWFGVEMSSITFALPQVLIAVCVADSVHILSGFYRTRKNGLSKRLSAEFTLTKNFVPTLLTSFTTAAGFFSFVTADLPPISGFGLLAGVGTMVAWVISYTVVGPLMVLWPGATSQRDASIVDVPGEMSPFWQKLSGIVERYSVRIVLVFGIVTVGAVVFASKNVVNSNPYEYFRRGLPIREAQEFVLSELSGVGAFEFVIEAGTEGGVKDPEFLRKVEALEQRALEISGVTRAISLVDVLRQTNRALMGGGSEYYALPDSASGVAQELLMYTMGLPQGMDVNDRISVKEDALRVTLISTLTTSNEVVATARKLEEEGQSLGLDVQATGKNMLYQSMNERVVSAFISSLLLAVVAIGGIVLLAFRSIKLGVLSAIPNVVPLCVGGGLLYFMSGRMDIGTVLVASVCLGIAVDNTIHILTNYRVHSARGASSKEAFEKLAIDTGPAMLATTMILVLGFSTFAFGMFLPNLFFGVLSAVTLGFGLLTDIVLLPAILLLLDRRRQAVTVAAPLRALAGE